MPDLAPTLVRATAIAACAGWAACADTPEVTDDTDSDLQDSAAWPSATLGLHDGAINHCDNFEGWFDPIGNPIFNAPGYPDYSATSAELANAAWWLPLRVGTVRVSVPWDIALPASGDRGLVIAHDPANTWPSFHLAALANEQTCLDWWLSAAAQAGVTVNIAFKPDYDYRDPATNHILVPDIATYRRAVARFADEYVTCAFGEDAGECVPASHLGNGPGPARVGRVHIITPWGEPDYGNGNYPKDSTDRALTCTAGCQGNALVAAGIDRAKEVFFLARGSSGMDPDRARFDDPSCASLTDGECGPVLAAQMWMAVSQACPDCVLAFGPHAGVPGSGVVAGDFSGGGGLNSGTLPDGSSQSYVKTYAQHLDNCAGCAGERPPTWGLHPYPDAANEEWCVQNTGHDFKPSADHGSNSTSVRFLDALDAIGYHEHTFVWLDEVSVFAHDHYLHDSPHEPIATDGQRCGVNGSEVAPVRWTPLHLGESTCRNDTEVRTHLNSVAV